MNIQIAKSMLVQERMDWNRNHLSWLPHRAYRLLREARWTSR